MADGQQGTPKTSQRAASSDSDAPEAGPTREHGSAAEDTPARGDEGSANVDVTDTPPGAAAGANAKLTWWQRSRLSVCFGLLMAAYVLGTETLHALGENPHLIGDGGAPLALVAVLYLGLGAAIGLGSAAFLKSARAQAAVPAIVFFVLVAVDRLGLSAGLLHRWEVVTGFIIITGCLFGGANALIGRFRLAPAIFLVVVFVAQNFLALLSWQWSLRGGRLLAFVLDWRTLALLGISAATVVLAFLAHRTRKGTLVFHSNLWLVVGVVIGARIFGGIPQASAEHAVSAGGGHDRPNVYVLSFDALRLDVVERLCAESPATLAPLCDGVRFQNVLADGLKTYEILARNTSRSEGLECNESIPADLQKAGYASAMYLGRRGIRIRSADCFQRYYAGSGWTITQSYSGANIGFFLRDMLAGRTGLRGRFIESELLLERFEEDFRDVDGPLFAYFHFLDLHAPYVPKRYENDAGYRSLIETYMQDCYQQACDPKDPKTAKLIAEIRRGYDMIVHEDIARVIQKFMKLATARKRRFVVALTADHGELFGEYGGFAHSGGFVPELLNVPFVVYDSEPQVAQPALDPCRPMLTSQGIHALTAVAKQGSLSLPKPVSRLDVDGSPLGRASVDFELGQIQYQTDPSMDKHRGTWRNIHSARAGTVALGRTGCETSGGSR